MTSPDASLEQALGSFKKAYPDEGERKRVLAELIEQHVTSKQAEKATEGLDLANAEPVRMNAYVPRAVYDGIYDDAEYYGTTLSAITAWRLRIALGLLPVSSKPGRGGRQRAIKPRTNGRSGRTMMISYDAVVSAALKREYRAWAAKGRYFNTQVDLAVQLLQDHYTKTPSNPETIA